MAKHIHVHLAPVRDSKAKDFDFNKAPFYILKRDTIFPMRLGWKKTSNMAKPDQFFVVQGTVFYQVAKGRFVPYFAKNGTPFPMSESNFQIETRDASGTNLEQAIKADPEGQAQYAARKKMTEQQVIRDLTAYGIDQSSPHVKKYLEAFRAAVKSKTGDASSVSEIEKQIRAEEQLLKARKQENSARLQMLKEELQKAKVRETKDADWSARHVGNFRFEVTTPQGKKISISRAETSAEAIEKAKKLPAGATHDAIAEGSSVTYLKTGERGKVIRRRGIQVMVKLASGKEVFANASEFKESQGSSSSKPSSAEPLLREETSYHVTGSGFAMRDSTFTGTESAWKNKVKDSYPIATFRMRPAGKIVAKVGDKDVGEYDQQKGAGTIVDKTEDASAAEEKSTLVKVRKAMQMTKATSYGELNGVIAHLDTVARTSHFSPEVRKECEKAVNYLHSVLKEKEKKQ